MPRLPPGEKRASLDRKRAKLDAQYRKLATVERVAARKADTRRKIILGSLSSEHAEKNPRSAYADKNRELLVKYVRPGERHLFPEIFGEAENPPQPETPPGNVTKLPAKKKAANLGD